MSMQDTPCSGYAVEAAKLKILLPARIQKKYMKAVKDGKVDLVDELLNKHLSTDYPGYESVFMLDNDDVPEDLERDVVYVIFQDEHLFVQTPTRGHDLLRCKGIKPEFKRWATWG